MSNMSSRLQIKQAPFREYKFKPLNNLAILDDVFLKQIQKLLSDVKQKF